VAAAFVPHEQAADEADGEEDDGTADPTAGELLNQIALPTDGTVAGGRRPVLYHDHLRCRLGLLNLGGRRRVVPPTLWGRVALLRRVTMLGGVARLGGRVAGPRRGVVLLVGGRVWRGLVKVHLDIV
jgi:hypothetical protein